MIVKLSGKTIPQIFAEDGEMVFRDLETKVLAELGKQSGLVIATGGGCVTIAENYDLLHQNGTIFWIQRDIATLPTQGRPLSQEKKLEEMYRIREPMYRSFMDRCICNNGLPEDAADRILEVSL